MDDHFVENARTLRAVRHFQPEPVPDPLVARWLEAARWCGSSRNSQPWRFVIVRDAQVLERLSSLGDYASHLADAPLAIAVAAVPGPFEFSTVFDLGRVAQTLMLAAHADGMGSCIAMFEGSTNIDAARDLLGVPTALRLDFAIAFGRPAPPAEEDTHGPSPRGRLPLDAIVADSREAAARWTST